MLSEIKKYVKLASIRNLSAYFVPNKNMRCGMASLQRVDCFIDVGANLGEFVPKMSELASFEVAKTVYVEPDPRYAECYANILGKDASSFFEPVCITNYSGEVDFNIFENGAVNSLLKSDDKFGESQSLRVPCTTGSALIEKYALSAGDVNILKIDVQGAETIVLEGFENQLDVFSYVIIEITFADAYVGQSEFLEILKHLDPSHVYAGNLSEVYSSDGPLDYMNAVFRNRRLSA